MLRRGPEDIFSESLCCVLAAQVDEKPVEDYSDVGGLDKQIKEMVEAIVLPVTHKDKFKALGIKPPKGEQLLSAAECVLVLHRVFQSKSQCHVSPNEDVELLNASMDTWPAALMVAPCAGVLLYGPPGTGKTLLARACAAQTNATFLKLAGPQLVQMFIGDGAKIVRDAFALAKEKVNSCRESLTSCAPCMVKDLLHQCQCLIVMLRSCVLSCLGI